MKKVFSVLLFTTISVIALAQSPTFVKKEAADTLKYLLSDTVFVMWQGKPQGMFFQGEVPKVIWNNFAVKYPSNNAAFTIIANVLALKAQFFHSDPLSFEPSKDQFFKYERETFTSSFAMSRKADKYDLDVALVYVGYKPQE